MAKNDDAQREVYDVSKTHEVRRVCYMATSARRTWRGRFRQLALFFFGLLEA